MEFFDVVFWRGADRAALVPYPVGKPCSCWPCSWSCFSSCWPSSVLVACYTCWHLWWCGLKSWPFCRFYLMRCWFDDFACLYATHNCCHSWKLIERKQIIYSSSSITLIVSIIVSGQLMYYERQLNKVQAFWWYIFSKL